MNDPARNGAFGPPGADRVSRPLLIRCFLLVALSCAVLVYWNSLSVLLGPDLRLDLGSITYPTKRLSIVWNAYTLWGTVSAVLLYFLFPSAPLIALTSAVNKNPRRAIAVCVLLVFLIVSVTRAMLLQFQPLTDDESAYQFAAETLRSGHLSIPTPSFGPFLERAFLVIEDRLYTQYFLGWPAVLALGGIFGLAEATNAIISALCVIPLAMILRRFGTTPIVIAGVLAYSASMMVIVMGATLLAHPACTLFLLVFIERSLRLLDDPLPRAALGVQCALAFSAAFFVRPGTALAIGAPFLIALAFSLLRTASQRWRAAVGFVIPALTFGALFLLTNWSLYGGPFETGYGNYQRQLRLAEKIQYLGPGNESIFDVVKHVIADPMLLVKLYWAAIDRFSYDFLGWPLPIFILCFFAAFFDRRLWPFVAGVMAFLFMNALILDFGIDSFGPVHLYEAGPLVLVLLCSSAQIMSTVTERRSFIAWRGMKIGPISPILYLRVTVAVVIAAWLLYFPLRTRNVAAMAEDIAAPRMAADSLEGDVIVFAPSARSGTQVGIRPLRHFVLFMPMNDIAFKNRVLWLRELEDDTRNIAVLKSFPGRRGYRLRWHENGDPVMIPVAGIEKQGN